MKNSVLNRSANIKGITLLLILWLSVKGNAQISTLLPPSGLMCDLVGQSDFQSSKGYPVESSYANLSDSSVQSVTIGSTHPAFTWQMNDTGENIMQYAYQVIVSDDSLYKPGRSTWNSGKVLSAQSNGVIYNGPYLNPNKAYYWKVRVWKDQGNVSQYSKTAVFYTGGNLKEHQPPIYPLQITEVKPVSIEKIERMYHVDFGKDAFGQLSINLFAESETDSVVIHLGEVLNEDGSINRKPPGTIRYARYVIKLRKGKHTYQLKIRENKRNTGDGAVRMPTYIGEVTPFRYVEIEGYLHDLHAEAITQLAVHYPFGDHDVSFQSSDTTLNRIWDLCKYTIKATSFAGLFVDGDRERIPYEADAYIAQLSDYAVNKEYTLARNSSEYLIEHPTWPTEWILQSVIIAWHDYLYTGDIQSVKSYYDDLKAKSLLALDSAGLISTRTGKMTNDIIASVHFNADLRDIVDWPQPSETDHFVFRDYNAVVNAFYYRDLVLLKKLATDLGKKKDIEFFEQKVKEVKSAYQKAFYDPVRKVIVDGIGTHHASLHANMFALAFGLVNEHNKKDVLSWVKSRNMACSVYGAQFLLDAVYDAGDGDYGLALLTSKNDRSWYNMIKVGSTITLEAWDNKYKPNQDWNHVWGAVPANIISRKLMGIEPLSPGWNKISIKPQIGNLSSASIDVPTVKGTIHAAYRQDGNGFGAVLSIPANTLTEVSLPIDGHTKSQVIIDGRAAKYKVIDGRALISNVGSGRHKFKVVY